MAGTISTQRGIILVTIALATSLGVWACGQDSNLVSSAPESPLMLFSADTVCPTIHPDCTSRPLSPDEMMEIELLLDDPLKMRGCGTEWNQVADELLEMLYGGEMWTVEDWGPTGNPWAAWQGGPGMHSTIWFHMDLWDEETGHYDELDETLRHEGAHHWTKDPLHGSGSVFDGFYSTCEPS